MTAAPAYTRAFSFTDYTANHPSDQQPGVSLDGEFNSIGVSINALRANLALIQRADGVLANGSVGPDQVSAELTLGLRSISDWVTAHDFIANDGAWFSGKLYRCTVSHTAGASFAADLTAGKWVLILDVAPYAQTAAAAAVTQEVLDGISLDVDLGPINTALAAKAGLADDNAFTGSNSFEDVDFSGLPSVARNTAVTALDYGAWKPTDYGSGNPGVFLRKKATAGSWELVVDDGMGGSGSLDLVATTLLLNGDPPTTPVDLTDVTTSIRRARNAGLTRR